eukprot:Gb_16735 [translate_table: standard]
MESESHTLGKPYLRRVAVKKDEKYNDLNREDDIQSLEPVTPAGRVFNQPALNCYIMVIIGFKKQIDAELIKAGLEASMVKHKRFSSIVTEDERGNLNWMRTSVNIDDHVVIPPIDSADANFVENYAAKLATAPPLDRSRPLWQIHLLNVKTDEAESTAVLRIHHSLGDGMSLMSLFLACTRKVSEPQSLPTIPHQTRSRPDIGKKRGIPRLLAVLWTFILVIWYTIMDIAHYLATTMWMQDTDTPIKGFAGVEFRPKRVVHVTVSLEDIKVVKNVVKGTVNDVMLAMTSAGLVRYLERRYEDIRPEIISKAKYGEKGSKQGMPSNLLVRSTILVNTRPAPGLHELADMMKDGKEARWGNNLSYMIIPFRMVRHDNALDYARAATVISKRKKLSLEAPLTYASGKLLLQVAGVKAATYLTYRMIANTTFSFSSMVGPVEEVEFFGHPITHIVPTVSGHPHALTIHFQSYMGIVKMVVSAAEDVIPDPKQLCMDCVDALHQMKQTALASKQYVN